MPELLYGTDEPKPERRVFRAGSVEVVLLGGAVRSVSYGGVEAVCGIAYLLRDEHWGTYPTRIVELRIEETAEGFRVGYEAENIGASAQLRFRAEIRGTATGLVFDVEATPLTDIMTSRCGFVVLHSGQLAGRPLQVEHSDGTTTPAAFPGVIDPLPVFTRIRALRCEVAPGVTLDCRVEGDDYEMEDQRNWGDYSFKTYVRPIRIPYPYRLAKGEAFRQTVTLSFDARASSQPAAAAASPYLSIGGPLGRTVPLAGILLDPDQRLGQAGVVDAIAGLGPKVLRLSYDHRRNDDPGLAYEAVVRSSPARLGVEAVLPEGDALPGALDRLARQLAGLGAPVAEVLITAEAFCRNIPLDAVNAPGLRERQHRLLTAARRTLPGMRIGAGTLGLFTELNRARPDPSVVDFVSHAFCPTVHDSEDSAVMDTVRALADIRASAEAFAPGKPHQIGPLALTCRFNPYGPGPVPNPGGRRTCLAAVDPRQQALFGAAWLVAAFAASAEAGIESVLMGAPLGPLGLMAVSEDGALRYRPAFHVARGLAQASGRALRALTLPSAAPLAGFCHAEGAGATIWLANTGDRPSAIELDPDLGGAVSSVSLLDAAAAGQAATDPRFLDHTRTLLAGQALTLPPYAVARLEIRTL
jgi:hypothetical protein